MFPLRNAKNNNYQNRPKDILPKIAILLCIAVLLAVLVGSFWGNKEEQMSYNDFQMQVKEGNVESVDINQSTGRVDFSLKNSEVEYYTNYPYSEDFIENLLLNDVKVEFYKINWIAIFFQYGLTPILIIAMMVAMTKSMGLSTVESMGDEETVKATTTFENVAGMEEIKEDLKLLAMMMKDPKYRTSGARIPRGILLEGPPGNGKTLLAKAFAGEAGVRFIAVNACDFGSKFVGVGSENIKKLFATARKNAPCVIFIDEIDAVGAKRAAASDAAGKEMNTMLTALLNQMDGFTPMDNIMVLAATNRVADLDQALLRPGRFDRQFIVDYPDRKTRRELIYLYTKDKNLMDDVDIDVLVRKTYGYSCSKIECIINEAHIISLSRDGKAITQKDFEDAILRMDIKGHLKKHFEQSESEKRIIAYHEAGHAVLGHFLTDNIISNVSLIPTTSGAGGFTLIENSDDDALRSIATYRNRMICLYGGRAAEARLLGGVEQATAGASQDINEVTRLAAYYVELEKGIDYSAFGTTGTQTIMQLTEQLLQSTWMDAMMYINAYWENVERVAQQLLEKETLTAEEFLELVPNKHQCKILY